MATRVGEVLSQVLQARRAQYNARFLTARRVRPALDPAAFAAFLEEVLDPLARAVAAAAPEAVGWTVDAAYEAALTLCGERLVGRGARQPWMEAGWRRVLPAAARLVAADPGRVIGAVSNALANLSAVPGARPQEWIERMAELAPRCGDVPALLRLGQVLAWRGGLAQYRAGALRAADALPEDLALAAVGAPARAAWSAVRQGLEASPWFRPEAGAPPCPLPWVAARVGEFRGWGGLFLEPPVVWTRDGQFMVRSGAAQWFLVADLHGATFHQSPAPLAASGPPLCVLPPGYRLSGCRLVGPPGAVELPVAGAIASAAGTPTTLAYTCTLTHAITLVALA